MDFGKIISTIGAYMALGAYKQLGENKERIDQINDQIKVDQELAQYEAEKNSSTQIERDLDFSYQLELGSIADTLWNGRFTWTIKNKSKEVGYYIQDICSTFAIAGYPCNLYVPGERAKIYLAPGETMTLQSTRKNKRWYYRPALGDIRSAIKKACGASSLVKCRAGAMISDLFVVTGTRYTLTNLYAEAKKEYNITTAQSGLLIYQGTIFEPKKAGSNQLDWK